MEIKFKRDTEFRRQFFIPDSFSHPAKMDAQLLIWITEHYSQPGEIILDPMAGSGTTMLACTLGRHVILVELEEKFCKMMTGYDCSGKVIGHKEKHIPEVKAGWRVAYLDGYYYSEPFTTKQEAEAFAFGGRLAEIEGEPIDEDQIEISYQKYEPARVEITPVTECGKGVEHKSHHVLGNWELVRMRPQLGYEMGSCQIIQGDARNLSNILCDKIITSLPYGNIDSVITSPPYAETGVGDWQTPRKEFQEWVKRELETKGYVEWQGKRYTETQWRAMNYGRLDGRTTKGVHKHPTDGYGATDGQIGNLPYGQIDNIITSPPFGDAYSLREGGQVNKEYVERRKQVLRKQGKHKLANSLKVEEYGSRNPDQIGNLPYGNIDSIITSPPYKTPMKYDGESKRRKIRAGQKLGQRDDVYFSKGNIAWQGLEQGYGQTEGNIGNLKGDTYLQAMLQVYQQCHKVLKPQGLLILVVKNFIRDKKEVDLRGDTIKLCECAGFSFVEEHYRLLPSQSFWRIIYQKRYPEAPVIDREFVLVFQK